MLNETPQGGMISAVDPNGIGAEVGIEPGDRLLSINGHVLRDIIDYRYYDDGEEIELVVLRDCQQHQIQIERDEDEPLGLTFADITFDGMRRCANHCPFCFVQQMPRGMRRSLYVHDDDYRYSFLLGNFVTLTNLGERDWMRIADQHLSPLYVSVHASDPQLRRKLLGNPVAPDIVAQLQRLGRAGIRVHAQIVVTPNLNDGEHLLRSITDLAELYPTVQTLAIVPVGLTRFQRSPLRAFGPDDARRAMDQLGSLAPAIRERIGCTWLYPSDELLLQAEATIPPAAFYDTDAQRENGVGLVRELLDDWEDCLSSLGDTGDWPKRITLVTGELLAPTLYRLLDQLQDATGMTCDLVAVKNRFFGETVTVAGLLTGQDVLDTLESCVLGDVVLLPKSMFEQTGQLTLDDITLASIADRLKRPVHLVESFSDVVRLCHLHGCA